MGIELITNINTNTNTDEYTQKKALQIQIKRYNRQSFTQSQLLYR